MTVPMVKDHAPDATEIEQRTRAIGHQIFSHLRSSGDLQSRLIDLSFRDPRIKAELFRFVDVLPVLSTDQQILTHLREYLDSVRDRLPNWLTSILIHFPAEGWPVSVLGAAARFAARKMARRFIAATDLPQAIAAVEKLRALRLAFTVDLLGEAVLAESEAERYAGQYHALIDGLASAARDWPRLPLLDDSPIGPVPRVNVSVKLSSLFSQFDPADPQGTTDAVLARLRPVLRAARQRGVFVNVDMEQYAYKDITLAIFRHVLGEDEFRDWSDVGIAIQAYLRSSLDDLRKLADWSRRRGSPVWVRLVKGAYWDYETVIARQNAWPEPVFSRKFETDANYEACSEFLIANRDVLLPAIASHNVRSISHALACAQAHGLAERTIEFQMLFGMADPIKEALVKMGQRVRVYTPFGALLPGMAYLVRRLLENTSNESFLRAETIGHVPEETLMQNPLQMSKTQPTAVRRDEPHFVNEALSDFARPENQQRMTDALSAVRKQLGQSQPLVIGGRRVTTGKWIESVNPSHRGQAVGRVTAAGVDETRLAIAAATEAFESWHGTPVRQRANLLRNAAEIMRRRRFELAAWEVFETGKQWREADADVAEAIDYCEFYAGEMLRLSQPRRRDIPGEDNLYIYDARGPAAVIAPWNFPLAILCGMATAALVAGNPVILKPAEQSPLIAARLMEIFEEAGFPPGVVNYLPGIGEEIGPALVGDPRIAIVAFTGSRAVGLAIQRQAAELSPGQNHLKRVITELGGKNAIIIDADADLDEAVHGVVSSAFGYAGQKCSACSRVIVLASVYEAFLERLIEATRSLRVGPAEDPGYFVGPVIDADAQQRILATNDRGQSEARLVYKADIGPLAAEGFYVPPTIFADVPAQSSLAQEEIFGPVLSVLRAADLPGALKVALDSQYALTGGLYSRSPANIDFIRTHYHVGNLYINRKITGAFVDRQPFGGFKLSGPGSKAGGPDYLLQFVQGRTITENTLRRGFAPEGE